MSIIMLTTLLITPPAAAAESLQAFKLQNGLIAHNPPVWFLDGFFIARERQPGYVFGSVQDFVGTLGGTKAWLIEDLELNVWNRPPRTVRPPSILCISSLFHLKAWSIGFL